jgi:hypothetical protein
MATKSKATKGGKYVCKIGYFDIRHKINQPENIKNPFGGGEKTNKGSVEAFIFHGRELYKGGFNDHKKAIQYAWEEYKKSNLIPLVSKSLISKYNLV